MSRDNNLLFLIFFLLALGAFLFLYNNYKLEQEQKKIEEIRLAKIEKIKNSFGNAEIEAQAFSVFDITANEKIYGKNDQEVLPIASLAKIMTVLVALDNHKIDEVIIVSKDSVRENGDSGLLPDEKWLLEDLAKFTLIASANDGAQALSKEDEKFLEMMNNKTADLKLNSTIFFNTTGLDIDSGFAGAYSTSQEINFLALYALNAYPEIFGATIMPEMNLKSFSGFEHKIKNTNIILDKIPNILFSKTGMTTLAGGNLVVIFQNKIGHQIAITVLGSTEQGRFSDMEKLVEIAYTLE